MSGGRQARPEPDEALVDLIVEALRFYRGAAPRSLVIAFVAAALSRRGEQPGPGIERAVDEAFDRGMGVEPGDPRPFRRPFGKASDRWALGEMLD